MPIGSAVHARTFPLFESLTYRAWSGFYAVSAYEAHHEHDYNAIRPASALIHVAPLVKYRVRGGDAAPPAARPTPAHRPQPPRATPAPPPAPVARNRGPPLSPSSPSRKFSCMLGIRYGVSRAEMAAIKA